MAVLDVIEKEQFQLRAKIVFFIFIYLKKERIFCMIGGRLLHTETERAGQKTSHNWGRARARAHARLRACSIYQVIAFFFFFFQFLEIIHLGMR